MEWAPGHDRFTSRPAIWRETEDGTRVECIGIGSVKGVEQNEVICSVPKTWPPKAEVPAAEPTPIATPATKEGSVTEEAAGAKTETEEPVKAAHAPEAGMQKLSIADDKQVAEKHVEGSTSTPPPGLA